jgi:hypothetical protein
VDVLFNNSAESEPDSDTIGQQEYWARIDHVTRQVIEILDEKEHWVIEGHKDFKSTLDELIGLVRKNPRVSEFIQSNPEPALKLIAYLHTSTAMMLMHVNAEARPAFVSTFLEAVTEIIKANPRGEAGVVANLALDRFLAFERTGLVARIFSKERVEGVLDAIERAGASASARRT